MVVDQLEKRLSAIWGGEVTKRASHRDLMDRTAKVKRDLERVYLDWHVDTTRDVGGWSEQNEYTAQLDNVEAVYRELQRQLMLVGEFFRQRNLDRR